MQHPSWLLEQLPSRSLLCGAIFLVASLPFAQAQQRQIGPADATSLAYSSSSGLPDAPATGSGSQAPTLGGPTQTQPQTPTYGGQRRYGRQTYKDRTTNADGSNKYAIELGGGFSLPTGSEKKYENVGFNIKAGGGYNFNRHIGALLEYDYVRLGIPQSIINNLNPGGGGSTNLWSLTLNPVYNYKISPKLGGYVIGGGGYYHKNAVFTQPVTSYGYYGGGYTVNQSIAEFPSSAIGADFGTGLTFKPSEYGRLKLFAEARYVWVDNQPKPGSLYPPAFRKTEFVPVTFGIRW